MGLEMYASLIFYMVIFVFVITVLSKIHNKYTVNNLNLSYIRGNVLRIKSRNIENQFYRALLIFVILLVMYLRKDIGTDYKLYELYCQQYSNLEFSFRSIYGGFNTEQIPFLFVKISSLFNNSIAIFNLLCALVIYHFLFSGVPLYRGDSDMYIVSLIMLFLFFAPSMNILRQMMAVSIVIWGLRYCIDRRYLKYIACCLLAMLCHSSAIVAFSFIAFSLKEKNTRLYDTVIVILSLVVPFIFISGFETMNQISLFSKYTSIYTDLVIFEFDYRYILAKIPIIVTVIFFWKKLELRRKDNRFFLLLFMVELTSILLGSWMKWAFRLMYYGYIAELVLIPQIPRFFKSEFRTLASLVIIAYYALYFLVIHFYLGYDGIFPYSI